jgi:hypothetical protein
VRQLAAAFLSQFTQCRKPSVIVGLAFEGQSGSKLPHSKSPRILIPKLLAILTPFDIESILVSLVRSNGFGTQYGVQELPGFLRFARRPN